MKFASSLYRKFAELINKEPDLVNRARIRILSAGLMTLLFACMALVVIYSIDYHPRLVVRAVIYILLFGITQYLLLFKRTWKLAGHLLLGCLLSVILSNMLLYQQGVSLLSIQYCLLIISGAFYVLGIRWGVFYAVVSIVPIFAYLLFWHSDAQAFFIKPQEVSSNGFMVVLAANFIMLALIHYHFFKSYYQVQEQGKDNQARLLAAMLMAEDSAKAKNNFLSSISHELRTPLNAVIGMSNVLLLASPRKDQEENLTILQFSAENLLTLINDLLDFNKMEADKIELEEKAFAPGQLLRHIYESFQLKASQQQLAYHLHIDPALQQAYVLGDQTRLMQVLVNLISNALKFTSEGSVTISATPTLQTADHTSILFTVKDTGTGIPADKQKIIFEPFMQASATVVRQYGGTGLGLPIVKRLLELHDSEIKLESTAGEGSTFSFEIRYKRAAAIPAVVAPPALTLPVNHLNVLVAEDNEVNAVVIKKILSLLGITHTLVDNGQKAVEAVINHTYDLVFMDIHMPVMDGLEAARQIRALSDTTKANLHIIVLSASDEGMVKDSESYALVNDFLPKPFSLQSLQDKLEQFTKKSLLL
jgi:signal transduction histidine kinase